MLENVKNFINNLEDEHYAKRRKAVSLIIAAITTLLAFIMLFVPFCRYLTINDYAEVISSQKLKAFHAFSMLQESRFVKNGLAFIALGAFVVWAVIFLFNVVFFIRGTLGFFYNEKKLTANTKQILIFTTVLTSVYYLGGFITALISKADNGLARSANNLFPLILALILDVIFALWAGILRWAKKDAGQSNTDTPEQKESFKREQKTLFVTRTELFIFSLVMTALALISLLTNILRVEFDPMSLSSFYSYTFEDLKINGGDLFENYATLSKSGQILAYIVFVLLTLCSTVFFLSLVGYLSRSKLFYKLALANVIVSVICCLLVGLFGQYYKIIQNVNSEMIADFFTALTGNTLNEEMTYKVKSPSIWYFVGAIVLLGGMLVRNPYSRGVALERELQLKRENAMPKTIKTNVAITEVSKKAAMAGVSTSGVGGATNGQTLLYADPCPAFTELDEKIPQFQAELAEKKNALFEDATLPNLVQFIVNYARDSRLHLSYTAEDVATFIAGLGTTRLSILQGMSGTGKTSLPKIFTEALFARCDIIEVESSWRDKSELLGYYNEFSKMFTPKKFTQALYRAKLNPETPTFIVLDEMNLSRIEYYFSDFLSLMENEEDKRELKLLNVGLFRTEDGEKTAYAGLTDGHTIKIPNNVWFIGTANRDESTFEISDKVYDRAHTMNFNKRAKKVLFHNEPIPQQFLPTETLLRLFADAKRAFRFNIDEYPVIAEVEKLLAPYNISFGNRIAMQIESFVSVYCSCFSITDAVIANAVETILLSKVVSKLELKSVDNKEQLAAEFEKLNLHKCSEFISKLNED